MHSALMAAVASVVQGNPANKEIRLIYFKFMYVMAWTRSREQADDDEVSEY